jgi:hypothetical protein
MIIERIRDLIFVEIDNEKKLVIACDSCGSIGEKDHDVLKVPPFITGKYTARVGLLEVLCTNSKVVAVIDNVCAEMDPTGREIIKGIEEELLAAGLKDVALGGSTEENFETFATGLGITVIGLGSKKELKVNNIKNDAMVYSLGIPKVGGEINLKGDEEIAQYEIIKELLTEDNVFEIVPVGSKGILYEAREIAKFNKKEFILDDEKSIDIYKSAGPATTVLLCISKVMEEKVKNIPNTFKVGRIK